MYVYDSNRTGTERLLFVWVVVSVVYVLCGRYGVP